MLPDILAAMSPTESPRSVLAARLIRERDVCLEDAHVLRAAAVVVHRRSKRPGALGTRVCVRMLLLWADRIDPRL